MPFITRVLIVEDDALLAISMEQLIEDLGHHVVGPMYNLNDGLDHARHDDLQFALLDFDLGHGTDAVPIAEELTRRGVPFAFTTGTDPKIIAQAMPKAKVLSKPVTQQDLVRLLA